MTVTTKIVEVKEQLAELVARLYQEYELDVEPTWPRILVRVLPREQKSKGGIILTGHQQNKPTLEGIVLKTYKPFVREVTKLAERANYEVGRSTALIKTAGDEEIEEVLVKACVEPGDHVLFPHMAIGIIPVWPLDEGKGDYRLVPDDQIVARLAYEKEKPVEWLTKLLMEPQMSVVHQAEQLLKNADVIRKDLTSKTLSGV